MDSFVADAIFIDALPERVFGALLEPEDILVWMDAEQATVDPRTGGQFTVRRADGTTVAGTIAACEPASRLEIADYSHQGARTRRGPMRLRFEIQPQGGGAWLVMRQDGLDQGADWKDFALATRRELVRHTVALKRHIEGI
jgi:uncharacterized protein YndB with AHSA1/START domain